MNSSGDERADHSHEILAQPSCQEILAMLAGLSPDPVATKASCRCSRNGIFSTITLRSAIAEMPGGQWRDGFSTPSILASAKIINEKQSTSTHCGEFWDHCCCPNSPSSTSCKSLRVIFRLYFTQTGDLFGSPWHQLVKLESNRSAKLTSSTPHSMTLLHPLSGSRLYS